MNKVGLHAGVEHSGPAQRSLIVSASSFICNPQSQVYESEISLPLYLFLGEYCGNLDDIQCLDVH